MNDNNDIDPDSIFLNPEYLKKIKQEDCPSIFGVEHDELPKWFQDCIEEWNNATPLQKSESAILRLIDDWIKNPEKSKIYRDKIQFATPFMEMDDGGHCKWRVEIPLFQMSF